jgi:hypothetical protein
MFNAYLPYKIMAPEEFNCVQNGTTAEFLLYTAAQKIPDTSILEI